MHGAAHLFVLALAHTQLLHILRQGARARAFIVEEHLGILQCRVETGELRQVFILVCLCASGTHLGTRLRPL